MSKTVRKAVFPVAGLGTRFLPATKAMPKEMLTVVDKPLIQHAVEEAAAAGIEEFIFVSGRGKHALEEHFDVQPELWETLERRGKDAELAAIKACTIETGRLMVVRQHRPLGLGHAVWCARACIGDEPFAVMLPDDLVQSRTPCLKQLTDVQTEHGGNVVATMEVPREQTSRYGILDIGKVDGPLAEITGLVEKPKPEDAPSQLSIIGRYILQPEIFDELERQEKGAGGEIQLTDAMARLIGRQPFHGYQFDGRRFDCGDKFGFLQANIALAMDNPDVAEKLAPFLAEQLESHRS